MQFDLYPHQADFVSDFKTRYLALIGGYGSGKTMALAVKLICLCLLNPGCTGLALSPTYGMAIRNLIPAIDDELWKQNIPFKFNKSELTYIINPGQEQTVLHVLPAEKYKRAAGLNLAFFGVDEADQLSLDQFVNSWNMLISRLRAPKAKFVQGVAVSTPEGFKGCYRYWVKEVADKVKGYEQRRMIQARTRDNKSLPQEYIEDLEAQYPPELLAAYLNGEFVNLKGLPVYYRYKPCVTYVDELTKEQRYGNWTSKTLDDFPDHPLHVGLDFNKGVNPCLIHVISNGYRYLVDEVWGLRDTDACILELKKRYANREMHFYPDAMGFEAYRNYEKHFGAGRVHYHPANPRVAKRVASLHIGICDPVSKQRRYFVNPEKCPRTDEAFQNQVYNANDEPDKDAGYDHGPDAAGYFHNWYYPADDKGMEQSALRL
jgi:hypothetical protein